MTGRRANVDVPMGPWRLTALSADAPRTAPWRVLRNDVESLADGEAELDPAMGRVAPFDVAECTPLRLADAHAARHWFVRDDGRAWPLPVVADRLSRLRARSGQSGGWGGPDWTVLGADWRRAWVHGPPSLGRPSCVQRVRLAAAAGVGARVLVSVVSPAFLALAEVFLPEDRLPSEAPLGFLARHAAGDAGALDDLADWAAQGAAGREVQGAAGSLVNLQIATEALGRAAAGGPRGGYEVDVALENLVRAHGAAWAIKEGRAGLSGWNGAYTDGLLWAQDRLDTAIDAALPLSAVLLAATGGT